MSENGMPHFVECTVPIKKKEKEAFILNDFAPTVQNLS